MSYVDRVVLKSTYPIKGNTDWEHIDNKPATYPPDTHTHDYSKVELSDLADNGTHVGYITIDGVEYELKAPQSHTPPTVGWDDVQNKPTVFPPETHTHDDRYYTETEVDALLAQKQNELVAGQNIIIVGNTISATGGGGGGSTAWSDITGKPETFPPESHNHTVSDITDFPTIPRKSQHEIRLSNCTVTQVNESGTSPASTSYKCVKVVTPDMDVQEGDLITLVWDSNTGTTTTYRNIYIQFGSSDTAKHWVLKHDGADGSGFYSIFGSAQTASSCRTNSFVYTSAQYAQGALHYQNYWDNTNYYIAICTTSASTASKVIATQYTQTLLSKLLVPVVFSSANTKQSALTCTFAGSTFTVYINGSASSSSNYTIPRGIVWTYFDKDNLIAYVSSDGSLPNKYLTDKQSSLTIDWSQITNKPSVYNGGVV